MDRRVSVRGAVIDGDKLLCVQLHPYDGAAIQLGDTWCIPGGGVDKGEALVDALYREMIEETGVAPEIGQLLFVQQFAHEGREFLECIFHIINTTDYHNIDLSKTSHGGAEIKQIAFVDPAKTDILPKFLTTEPLSTLVKEQHPAKFFSYL